MRVIAVFAGRFHPLHKGHAGSFNQLAQKFGLDNTYLAISAKQEQPKSPFSAQDRAKMAVALGIPAKNIIAVNNPYKADEYVNKLNLDPDKTALVFGVSKKDMEGDAALGIPPDPRFSFAPKRDGSPPYMQPYSSKNLQPMSKHGYVMSTDVAEFPIAGKTMRDASAIRKAYAGADNKTKMRILTDLYGDKAEQMKQVFDNNLQVTESIRRLISQIKPIIGEATFAQKAKFVKLLSEAKRAMLSEAPGSVYSARMANIIEDLGNGYFLGDDSYDDDEGFPKEGYSVWHEEGSDQFRHVGHVVVSPYHSNAAEIDAAIDKLITDDRKTKIRTIEDTLPGLKFPSNIKYMTKLSIIEAYVGNNGNLMESNTPDDESYFLSLSKMSDPLIIGNQYILVPLIMLNDQVSLVRDPERVTLLNCASGKYTVEFKNGARDVYPNTTSGSFTSVSFLFTSSNTYDKLRAIISLRFGVDLPEIHLGDINSLEEDNDGKMSGVEHAYNDPDTHAILSYAKQHYPEEPDLQSAFVKFVLRSLKHAKDDDKRQDNEIELLMKRVNSLQNTVDTIKNKPESKVNESAKGQMKPTHVAGKEKSGSVNMLEKGLLSAKDRGNKLDYASIDKMMQSICHRFNLTGDKLHNDFVKKHHCTPDKWVSKQDNLSESVDYLDEK